MQDPKAIINSNELGQQHAGFTVHLVYGNMADMTGVGGLRMAVYCCNSGAGGAGAWSICTVDLVHHELEDLN